MKAIYITVLLVFVISVSLFVISFVYLDRSNHRVFYYDVAVDGQYAGTTRIDKFITEEKLIYKSVSKTPFRELFTEERVRLDLDAKYNLEDYQKELFASGLSYLFYAVRKGDNISFLTRSMSRFISLSSVPVRKGTFVFEEDSPVTYFPIIENYDFRRGSAQGFNSIIYLPDRQLPPVKRFVTLTSIKDEHLKIGHRKIKTENLLLKIKGLPSGSIWVAKSDRSLMLMEIPSIGLKITRSFEPKEVAPKQPPSSSDACLSKDVLFQNKTINLSGTLTMPKEDVPSPTADGKYPAILLIWGSGPQDRNYQGMFESIATYLPKYGYCVLRFDKRGVGTSGGEASLATPDSELEDLTAALNFLRSQNNVNTNRISLIAHSEGALDALRLSAENPDIKGVILAAPFVDLEPQEAEEILRLRAAKEKWDDEYLKLVLRALQETRNKAVTTKRNWSYIAGKKCYMKAVRDEAMIKPLEVIEKVSAPILILQGRKDTDVLSEYAKSLDKALSEHGHAKHRITYLDNLGHFFGKLNVDGISRMRYIVDNEVLAAMRDWLNLNTTEVAKPEETPSPAQ